MQPLAFIPSPSQGVWHLGPIPVRAYAIMIIIGIVVAVWLGERRWAAKGGAPGVIIDVAVWAVPFGLVGGRLYHVVTDYQLYFGDGGEPVKALKIWEGGLGIWGAVVLGALGAWIGCRRHGVSVAALGDAIAPGIALAQAIGRWGNYWNQELYGRPLDTFWALKIDYAHRPTLPGGARDPEYADVATYHPTFLYESLWCIGVAIVVIWAGRRYKLTHGRTFALYVAAYTLGRFWIESLRIDEAHHVLGMRLNDWTAVLVFVGAIAYLFWARRLTGPEELGHVPATPGDGAAAPAAGAETDTDSEPEAEPKAEAEGGEKVDLRKKAEPKPEPETEPEADEKPEADADPKDDEPEPEPEPEAESAAAADEPEDEPEPKAAEDGPEPEPAAEAEPVKEKETAGADGKGEPVRDSQ